MKNTTIIGVIIAVLVIAGVGFAVTRHQTNPNPQSSTSSTNSFNTTAPTPTNSSTAPTSTTSQTTSPAAASVAITGGTNGPACGSGGYFKPSSVTVNSGDTITFSVPADDPYSGGLQINGFPQGSFAVARGSSMTTSPITANVSFNGTWPNSPSCMKGSGSVTVK